MNNCSRFCGVIYDVLVIDHCKSGGKSYCGGGSCTISCSTAYHTASTSIGKGGDLSYKFHVGGGEGGVLSFQGTNSWGESSVASL
jgi:hypothetical protein